MALKDPRMKVFAASMALVAAVGCMPSESNEPEIRAASVETTALDTATTEATTPAVSLTPGAASQVNEIVAANSLGSDIYLRVAVKSGGCSGFLYELGFEDEIDDGTDRVFVSQGIRVVIDKKSLLFVDGTVIDFYDGADKRGFTFDNPNAVCVGEDEN